MSQAWKMILSIGQCVALATHANAALSGQRVSLSLAENPWFEGMEGLAFYTGDRSTLLGADPNAWFDALRAQGFTGAYLWIEPFDGSMRTIDLLSFRGGTRWAPVTTMPGAEIIWHEKVDDVDGKVIHERLGFRVQEGQHSVRASKEEAFESLERALSAATEFESKYMAGSRFGGTFFQPALKILRAELPFPEEVFSLFPGGYPMESYRLVGAVHKGWALGGMGWWNDSSPSGEGLSEEFNSITFDYYEAMGKALAAACAPDH